MCTNIWIYTVCKTFQEMTIQTTIVVIGNLRVFHRGYYMSAHVLLNLLNKLGKRDKMGGLPSIFSFSQQV